jgi:hypothetical protein
VGSVGWGAYEGTIALQKVVVGFGPYTGRPLSTEERIDVAAGLLGGLAGGARALRPPLEPEIGGVRIAPYGNRKGALGERPLEGELPHYHRGVPDPDNPGASLPGQSKDRHRPWESSRFDKTWCDRF